LGLPIGQIFSSFSEPVAAASIAQVHKAVLADAGQSVAVKVLRPGIEKAFQRDVDAFYFAAGVIEFLLPGSRRLRPLDVIEHFEGVVLGELDLRLESSAAAEFRENTKDDAGFGVPEALIGAFCLSACCSYFWAMRCATGCFTGICIRAI
jgi:ubiquinone biosynthesis protein